MICPYKPMLRVRRTEQRRDCGSGFVTETKYCYELQQCVKDKCLSWSAAQNGCKYYGYNSSEE